MADIDAKILTPDETDRGIWCVVINGWHTEVTCREQAERIISTCKMCAAIAEKQALANVRVALGLEAYGSHARR